MLGEAAAWSLGDRSFTYVSWRLMLFMGLGAERMVLARRGMVIERVGLIFNFMVGMGGWGWLCVFVGGWMDG